MFLDECTDSEIENAASILFHKNEENIGCIIKSFDIDRNLGIVTITITESVNGPTWEVTEDFDKIDPFIRIDDNEFNRRNSNRNS